MSIPEYEIPKTRKLQHYIKPCYEAEFHALMHKYETDNPEGKSVSDLVWQCVRLSLAEVK